MELSDEQRSILQSAARKVHPREACGVIAGSNVIQLENHAQGYAEFHLKGTDIENAAAKFGFRELDAVWHSHPSGNPLPSKSDLESHPWPAAMVIVTSEKVSIYGNAKEAESAANA